MPGMYEGQNGELMKRIDRGKIVLVCAMASFAANANSTTLPRARTSMTPTLRLSATTISCLSRSLTHKEMFQASSLTRDHSSDRTHQGHRIWIAGGLLPSATVAGQASALDPARAAVAAAAGSADTDRVQAPDGRSEPGSTTVMPQTGRCR
jgi:hypothetical protein